MNWLTFVGICNCSHRTVGRTEGFRSGRYELETQPLTTLFNFINTTENRNSPYYALNFSMPQVFWHIEKFPKKFFSTVRQKIFERKHDTSLSYLQFFFHTRSFLKHRRVPLQSSSSRSCETENFWQNREAPLLCMKIFETRNFSKHRRVPVRILSALWDNKISTQNSDIPLLEKFFWYPKFFETLKCSPTNFFGTVKQKVLNEKSWFRGTLSWKV